MNTRRANGRFAPGRSGNPGGRPGGVAEFRALARSHAFEAIERLFIEMNHGDTSAARIAAARVLIEHGIGKPVQQIETPEPPAPALTNEERKERARELLAIAFGRVIEGHPELGSERSMVQPAFEKVIEDHPELAGGETKCGPPAPSTNVAPTTIEQPTTALAASNGHDRVERRPRVFALPRSRPMSYRQRSSWSN